MEPVNLAKPIEAILQERVTEPRRHAIIQQYLGRRLKSGSAFEHSLSANPQLAQRYVGLLNEYLIEFCPSEASLNTFHNNNEVRDFMLAFEIWSGILFVCHKDDLDEEFTTRHLDTMEFNLKLHRQIQSLILDGLPVRYPGEAQPLYLLRTPCSQARPTLSLTYTSSAHTWLYRAAGTMTEGIGELGLQLETATESKNIVVARLNYSQRTADSALEISIEALQGGKEVKAEAQLIRDSLGASLKDLMLLTGIAFSQNLPTTSLQVPLYLHTPKPGEDPKDRIRLLHLFVPDTSTDPFRDTHRYRSLPPLNSRFPIGIPREATREFHPRLKDFLMCLNQALRPILRDVSL